MRIGIGYDIHRLEEGFELIVGGVNIPYKLGLKGHSDSDVLFHSVCDAVLGAANLGDIGEHFPDTDSAYKNINSAKLLQRSYKMVRDKDLTLENLDATIFAQAPRFSPYKNEMEKNIAISMNVNVGCINIKATTTEYLGTIGKGNGIAAMCVVLLV